MTQNSPRSRHLSFANVLAVAALIIAAGGGGAAAYAAGLAKNSVGSTQIKSGAVRSADIRNSTVKSADLKYNTVKGWDVKESTLGTVPSAASATLADTANLAVRATQADKAALADRATQADKAALADRATQADKATQADRATVADKASVAVELEGLAKARTVTAPPGETVNVASKGPLTLELRCDRSQDTLIVATLLITASAEGAAFDANESGTDLGSLDVGARERVSEQIGVAQDIEETSFVAITPSGDSWIGHGLVTVHPGGTDTCSAALVLFG